MVLDVTWDREVSCQVDTYTNQEDEEEEEDDDEEDEEEKD